MTTYIAPRMHFSDRSPGYPCAKDPAVVRLRGRYLLYYSVPPGGASSRWGIHIAASDNLLDWRTIGQLGFTDRAEARGIAAPGAIMLGGRLHLFYQSYDGGPSDAICHAVSDDGLSFVRSDNPVFAPTGGWTCGRAIDADVVVFQNRLLLYWATRDPEMRIQMQGVSAAALDSGFGRDAWQQLDVDGPILRPRVPTPLDSPGIDIAWEGGCIEAAATLVRGDKLYLFYGGGYNNAPQQIGVAISDDGVQFRRLNGGRPVVPCGRSGAWNDREAGHPFCFRDEQGQDWLFYQGNNAAESAAAGRDTWYLSAMRIEWQQSADGTDIPIPVAPA